MERKNAWKDYTDSEVEELMALGDSYIDFISNNKTEREFTSASIELAEKAGYKPLEEAVKNGTKLVPGDKVWAHTHGKTVLLVNIGTEPMVDGMNILGAHIDSPRLDIKQNRIMTVLTVITSIFMPLTLITGWFGMNFKNMPELDSPIAYPMVFVMCVIIIVVCLIFFKRKRWL